MRKVDHSEATAPRIQDFMLPQLMQTIVITDRHCTGEQISSIKSVLVHLIN